MKKVGFLKRKTLPSTENQALQSVCDYLQLNKKRKGYMFWRTNNIPVYDGKNFRSMPKYSIHGIPDVIVIWNGQFVGLEIKTNVGKQSDGQKEFEKQCREVGGEYYVIRGIDEVKEIGL